MPLTLSDLKTKTTNYLFMRNQEKFTIEIPCCKYLTKVREEEDDDDDMDVDNDLDDDYEDWGGKVRRGRKKRKEG